MRLAELTVFPTHVGVFPTGDEKPEKKEGLPHARGGVSFTFSTSITAGSSSPRTWGCFCYSGDPKIGLFVFPTHVGVFASKKVYPGRAFRLPHARGGVSATAAIQRLDCSSSPRTWGCFHAGHGHETQAGVFPTHVGVFLKRRIRSAFGLCLPYARGIFQKKLLIAVY